MPTLRTKLEHLQRLATLQPHEKGDPLRQNEARTAAHIFLQTVADQGWTVELREPGKAHTEAPRQDRQGSFWDNGTPKPKAKERTQQTDYYLITFKFPGTCRKCRNPIHEGSQGYWKRGAPCYHVECAPEEIYQ